MKKALALAFLGLVGLSATADAGRLSPGLEQLMQGKAGDEELKVLVVLREQADVPALNQSLKLSRSTMAERHRTVIDALRATADATQAPLLQELALERSGSISSFQPYWLVNSVLVTGTIDAIRDLATRPDVDVIEPNLPVELIRPIEPDPAKRLGRDARAIGITPGVVSIQARRVWEELGVDGTGALVANMDTGVDGTHPALSARWRGNFAPASECWNDAVGFGDVTPVDRHYHGTHVMGTITGQAPNDTIGVAPGALWIADNSINQSAGGAFDADVLAALQWFSDPDGNSSTTDDVPDVVQNSWGVNEGFSGYFDCDSRWWAAMDNCEAAGVVLTWSAGNEGPGSMTLRSPADRAATPYNAFSVGSTIHSAPFTISSFSSRGPSGCGGAFAMKPEVCAPGSDIYSAEPGGGYQLLSGTSMAGPHVAGVVALMRSANPDLDVDTIKQILMDTATDLGTVGEDNTYGHGFINAYDAVLAVLDGYGVVEGTVTDIATTLPIANATVNVIGDPRSAATDASGFFRLHLPAGTWTLEYSAFGYLTDTAMVESVADSTTDGGFAMTLAPTALVSGTITDFESNLVDGATVTAMNTPLAPVMSAPDGTYSIAVPDGATYDFRAHKAGLGAVVTTLPVSGAATLDFVLPELFAEDFESGDFIVWPWTMSGTGPWTIDTSNAYEGLYAARSGAISHNQTSTATLDVFLAESGDLKFWYDVSTESGFDYLKFYLDGVLMDQWSGTVPWTQATYPVGSGFHTFTWTYSKDGSVNGGADAVWIDFIEMPRVTPPVYPEIAVSPGSVTETLSPGGTSTQPLTIDNTGEGELSYGISILEAPAPAPRPQELGRAVREEIDLAKGEVDPRVGDSPLLGSGGPDGFGYRWIDSDDPSGPAYVWVEINSVGTPLAMGDDTYLTGVPMGISFPYYGNVYSSVNISTNGFVSFSAPSGSYYTNGSLPSTTDPDDMICAYWDDLNANDGGTIYTYADAANARFIVEWDGVPRYGTGGTQLQTFQIILGADGTILTQYRSVNNVISSTVGIENADGSDGLEVVFNAAYLHDGLTILFTNAPPISWLTASPSSGLVPAFGSGAVSLDFDAAGLTAGTYEAIVRILSNDQDEAVTDIPVTLTIGGATDVVVTPAAPTRFELGRPQPNPFGSLSTVEYAVPDAARALTIAVYDVSGRRVRTLVNGAQPVGRHQVAWDGRDETGRRVASGVYFYRLDTEDVSQVRKVTLLK